MFALHNIAALKAVNIPVFVMVEVFAEKVKTGVLSDERPVNMILPGDVLFNVTPLPEIKNVVNAPADGVIVIEPVFVIMKEFPAKVKIEAFWAVTVPLLLKSPVKVMFPLAKIVPELVVVHAPFI